MKKFLTLIAFVGIIGCLSSFGKSPSYISSICSELSSQSHMIVENIEYGDSRNLAIVRTPSIYDEELAQMSISLVLDFKDNVTMIEPWSYTDRYLGCAYRIDANAVTALIYSENGQYYICFVEWPNAFKSKVKKSNKGKSKSKRKIR